jgi:ribosomal protein L12E/L44/L45/RPP1/RPP2
MMTLEADSVNVQALDMGHIVVDIDGVNITELINKAAENGYSLRVVDDRDSTETPATYASQCSDTGYSAINHRNSTVVLY